MNPRRTNIRNENFATMEFEFKNSLDPDNNESIAPELKLLNDGSDDPESGASVVAGMEEDEDEDDEDDDDEDDGENAFRKASGIIELIPLLLPLPLSPLLPLPLPLPLNMFILYYYYYFILYLFYTYFIIIKF
jgi:hypothetical protein